MEQILNHAEAGLAITILLTVWARMEHRLTRCERDHKEMRWFLMKIYGDR